jgi:hypothetical protein
MLSMNRLTRSERGEKTMFWIEPREVLPTLKAVHGYREAEPLVGRSVKGRLSKLLATDYQNGNSKTRMVLVDFLGFQMLDRAKIPQELPIRTFVVNRVGEAALDAQGIETATSPLNATPAVEGSLVVVEDGLEALPEPLISASTLSALPKMAVAQSQLETSRVTTQAGL